jgi:pimeloyl-ACP methyl ester carboxylesterase
MDAAGSERAVLFGISEGASMALLFAATYPQRTRSLLAWGAMARWFQADDYPWGMTREESDRLVADCRENWPSLWYLTGPGAGIPRDDRELIDFWVRYGQAAASPAAAAALEQMNQQIDVRDILPTIRVPTLVMNRSGDPVAHGCRAPACKRDSRRSLRRVSGGHAFHGRTRFGADLRAH